MNIIVTGCSRGVGLEICRVLLEQGNTVYGIARSCPDEFKALQSEYGGKLFFKSVDLSDCENVRQNVFKDYCGNKIRIDGYVNNAAVAYDDIVTNLNLERLKAMYNVNVFTPMMMTKNVIRNMILHHTKGGHQRRGEHGVAHFRHHYQHGGSRSGARRPRPQLPAHHHAQAHEGRLRERARRAVGRLQTVQRRHGAHVRPDLLQGHGRSARRVRGAGGRARRAHALGRAGSARFAHDLQARHAPPGQPLHADRHGRGARAARPRGL